ncbi:MAG: pentapeptide repeat-containing protein [Erysipelotrichia bacterium]|nr:pentapeptide repeat-containing protein [Erysipelotrichia bacterium]
MSIKRSLPAFEDDPVSGTLAKLGKEYRFEWLEFKDEECDRDLSDLEFHECSFRHISFVSNGRGTLFADVIFDHCDFSNRDFEESVFRRVQFSHCRLTGIDLTRCTFEDVEFDECEARYSAFGGSHFNRVLLNECVLVQAGFSSCRFEKMELHEDDFTEAEFVETKLKDMDFSDCMFQGIMVSPEDLKGIILNEEQALMCVKLLGVQVKQN